MDHRKTVGVYTPFLQGFYFGELISQLQQYCFIKGYDFTVIKTDSLGAFSSSLHSDHIDFVIILRNAIHNDLAKSLLEKGKRIISIAYDYFPLSIPMIRSDNELGIELAFNHLLKNGHRNIAFVGDLSQYDIRKRYEAFCDQHEINNIELKDNNIFVVQDTLFSGGYQAAQQFIGRNCTATGIICGASLTSIGFAQQMNNLSNNNKTHEIIGFDAISLIPVTQPGLAMVDQNLHLIAYKALTTLEAMEQGEDFEQGTLDEIAADKTLKLKIKKQFLVTLKALEDE